MEIKKTQLEDLVKSPEWIDGYKQGLLEKAQKFNKISIDLVRISEEIKSCIEKQLSKKNPIRAYAIFNGTQLMNKRFNTKDEAWDYVLEICGDKISPIGKFKIVRI